MVTKDLLQRINIKTMKKDIASLREADSLAEKQKISNIEITPELVDVGRPEDGNFGKAENSRIQPGRPTSAPQSVKQVPNIDADVKMYATEIEKQQIFLLQSRRVNLEKQINGIGLEEGASFQAQKAKVLVAKERAQKTLDTMPLVGENGSEQSEDAQKKRWVVENELAKLEETIKSLDQDSQRSQITQNNIKKEIVDIDNSLKAMYESILQRQKAKEEQLQQLVDKKAEIPAIKPVKNISEKVVPLASRPAFAKSSGAAMEKLEKSTEVEQVRRLKFMEDVERWAASLKKDGQNN